MSRPALVSGVLSGLLLGAPIDTTRAQSAPAPDSGYAPALLSLRDSVAGTRIELQAFQRDLRLAGPETVVRRAALLNRHCAGLVDAVRQLGRQVRAGRASARGAGDELVQALGQLDDGLTVHCVHGLAPEGPGSRADTLRAWGPHRTARIDRLLADYDRAAQRFARVVGVKLEPRRPGR